MGKKSPALDIRGNGMPPRNIPRGTPISVVLRPAHSSHYNGCRAVLEAALHSEYGDSRPADELARELGAYTRRAHENAVRACGPRFVVAMRLGQVVGYAMGWEATDRRPWLGQICVHPEYQGHWIGRRLWVAVLAGFGTLGHHEVFILAQEFQHNARRFYERQGAVVEEEGTEEDLFTKEDPAPEQEAEASPAESGDGEPDAGHKAISYVYRVHIGRLYPRVADEVEVPDEWTDRAVEPGIYIMTGAADMAGAVVWNGH